MSLLERIDKDRLPKHIAIIMDGNGRWAKRQGKNRVFGHNRGVKSAREITEAAAELGIKHLTLYTFSTENWNRPKLEISALMELLLHTIRKETSNLNENNIRLRTIGDISKLPKKTLKELQESMAMTEHNDRMDLILALNYSGRFELVQAMQQIAREVELKKVKPEEIDQEFISKYLFTQDIPDPELLIRTSGENRISNFLLWQCAYTEFYFTEKLWPEFDREALYEAVIDFQSRERRFGKTSEQLLQKSDQDPR